MKLTAFLLLSWSVRTRGFVVRHHRTPPQQQLVLHEQQQSTTDHADDEPSIDQPDTVEENSHDELMYALGVNLARQLGDVRPLVESGPELAQLAKGLLDTIVGRLSEKGQTDLLLRRGTELNQLITDRANTIKERLAQAGVDMLQGMKETEGAEELSSGVVVHVLEGNPTGMRPTQASTVKLHYHGTLADGTVFDSTLKSGEPVNLPLKGTLAGLREALQVLHEQETAMVGIPPSAGYGDNGTPDGRIPGGSTLFFKVQLLEVLSAGIGGEPTLLGADGKSIKKDVGGSGLIGADGKPL